MYDDDDDAQESQSHFSYSLLTLFIVLAWQPLEIIYQLLLVLHTEKLCF